MSEERKTKEETLFETCLATRNMEIDLFWKRSIFFWGFIAISFAGYATLKKDESELSIYVASFGFFSSVCWILINRGSKWWQQNWEEKLQKAEEKVIGRVFRDPKVERKETTFLSHKRYSVTKVTTLLSYFSALTWALLVIHDTFPDIIKIYSKTLEIDLIKAIPLVVTFFFTVGALARTKGDE